MNYYEQQIKELNDKINEKNDQRNIAYVIIIGGVFSAFLISIIGIIYLVSINDKIKKLEAERDELVNNYNNGYYGNSNMHSNNFNNNYNSSYSYNSSRYSNNNTTYHDFTNSSSNSSEHTDNKFHRDENSYIPDDDESKN